MTCRRAPDPPPRCGRSPTPHRAVRRPARRGLGRGKGRLPQPASGQVLPGAARPPGPRFSLSIQATCHVNILDAAPAPITLAPASSSTRSPTPSTSRTGSSRWRSADPAQPARASSWPSSPSDLCVSCCRRALSDSRLKKPMPLPPRAVGLITGRDSDAEKDVLQGRPSALAGGAIRRCGAHAAPTPPARRHRSPRAGGRWPRRRHRRGPQRWLTIESLLPVLRPGHWSALVQTPVAAGRQRDRPSQRPTARFSTWSPTCAARPLPPTPPSGSCPIPGLM